MKKLGKTAVLLMAASLVLGSSMTSFAAWQSDETGWWWQNDDGTWPADTWQWLDGNGDGIAECYYFGSDGYMLEDTTTPDGYTVDANGAWIEDGEVQVQTVASDSDTESEDTADSESSEAEETTDSESSEAEETTDSESSEAEETEESSEE